MNTDTVKALDATVRTCARCGTSVVGLAAEGPNVICSNCAFPAIGMEEGANRQPSCEAIRVSMHRGLDMA